MKGREEMAKLFNHESSAAQFLSSRDVHFATFRDTAVIFGELTQIGAHLLCFFMLGRRCLLNDRRRVYPYILDLKTGFSLYALMGEWERSRFITPQLALSHRYEVPEEEPAHD